jgi:hypothetical protein
MDFKIFKFGAIPSPEDKRDYPISRLIGQVNVFPDEFILKYSGEIKNQNGICSCVPHSLSYCREITEEQQSKIYKKFSPGFVYANREFIDYQGQGMYPREAIKSLQNYGIVEYYKFPYNEEYPAIKSRLETIKSVLFESAKLYKITYYCRIYTIDGIKNALMQLGSVSICIPVYDSFYKLNNYVVPMPQSGELLHGYHEMTIIGWNKSKQWIVLNSWGNSFGDNGKCYIPFEFSLTEAWSMTDTILPHPEPEPEKQKYWRIQVGSFIIKENAVTFGNKLKSEGFNVYIVNVNNTYKVQLNAFIDEIRARTFLQKVRNAGYIDAWLTYY